jgi:hypothetical protein
MFEYNLSSFNSMDFFREQYIYRERVIVIIEFAKRNKTINLKCKTLINVSKTW